MKSLKQNGVGLRDDEKARYGRSESGCAHNRNKGARRPGKLKQTRLEGPIILLS